MLRRTISLLAKQSPYGGRLRHSIVEDAAQREYLVGNCTRVLDLNERQSCDVECLIVGAFSPLEGMMNEQEYNHCLTSMKLSNGLIWGLPVVLDSDGSHPVGSKILLRYKGVDMAVMNVESRWRPDKALECKHAYGFTTIEHPAVRMVSMERKDYYIGGKVTGLELPRRSYPAVTPRELRAQLPMTDVVAFQCRNPIHRAHFELFMRALDAPNVARDGVVLVHPTCGPTQDDDVPGETRVKTYRSLEADITRPESPYYERAKRVRWSFLPYSMHMAGPREAIQHMIVRRNYGCTHFIIGRDMAGCKSSITGEDFYKPYDAQEFARANAQALGMQTVESLNLVYTEEAGFVTEDEAKSRNLKIKKLSGTEFRRLLRSGGAIPEWFSFKSVIDVLRKTS